MEMPDVAGVRHRFVEVDGARLHVAEAGDPAAEPVLLLHGFPQHWYAWRHVMPLLAERYRVIAPDVRGFGWSDAPKHGYGTLRLAADVVGLLDALELPSARIVGHDWGAATGFVVAVRHPSRVDALVALNMTHPWPRMRRLAPNLWRMWHTAFVEHPPLGRLVLRHRPGFVRFLLRHWAADAGMWDREELDLYAGQFADMRRARAGEQFNAAYVWRDIFGHPRGRLRRERLTVSTLMVLGGRDVVMPARVVEPTALADRLRIEVVAEGGHLLPEEWPDRVAEAVMGFFEEPAMEESASLMS